MAQKRTMKDRPVVDKEVAGLVTSAVQALVKVYGMGVAEAATRIEMQARREATDAANQVVLDEMKLGRPRAVEINIVHSKPGMTAGKPRLVVANDTKPGVAKASAKSAKRKRA